MPLRDDERLIIVLLVTLAVTIVTATVDRVPYHTSALTGQAWVQELIEGHPERIHHELGLYRETFITLVHVLRSLGHGDSRYCNLEEQLAIFLYTCRTSMSVRHVGERFQRSNETIAKFVLK